ncbi:uncharacterized protein LOC130908006 [Corythoichthys intestinalis]|uniref:uncharacterized protein LOC130908006 n=1 Tax=Corythoichthys intestinalis TaxID=161448 RepID=UPI0025A4D6A3|nr:uncharacterized protein LOC130908006 [Corythoichthys intestinalis]
MTAQGLILIFLLQYQVIRGGDVGIYAKVGDVATLPLKHGLVQASSTRSQRLGLKDNCSLLIQRLTAEDAGYYTCDPHEQKERVYLTVLTVTSSPAMRGGEVDLKCSLTHWYAGRCFFGRFLGNFHWLNEEGQELPTNQDLQDNCTSTLKVLSVDHYRNFTCQYRQNNRVIVQTQYTVNLSRMNTWIINAIRVVAAILIFILICALAIDVMVKSRRNAG